MKKMINGLIGTFQERMEETIKVQISLCNCKLDFYKSNMEQPAYIYFDDLKKQYEHILKIVKGDKS